MTYRITCDECGGTEPVTDDETPEAVMARHWCRPSDDYLYGCYACEVGVRHDICTEGRVA